jgi:DNA-binding NarL/FixJ family response regulator
VIGVVIADDQALVRGGFRAMLQAQADIDVLGEAGDGEEAVDLARELRPDVVLMDVRMPKLDGLEATRRLLSDPVTKGARVLMLTTFDRNAYVYEALKAGASGFLLKDAPPERLVEAVRTIAAGEALLAPSIVRRLIEQYVQQPPLDGGTPSALAALSARELEVLTLVARGHSNLEIAGELYVSPATVKTHVASIFSKLGLRDRVQAVVVAYETGLIRPGQAA